MSVHQFVKNTSEKFESIENDFLRNFNQTMEATNLIGQVGQEACKAYISSLSQEDQSGIMAITALIKAEGHEEISKRAKKFAGE